LDMHHIITDGVSSSVLKQDFFALYQGRQLAPLSYQYKDYAFWQSTREWQHLMDRQEQYWLKSFVTPPPALKLPLDSSRSSGRSMIGDSYSFQVSPQDTGALEDMARQTGTTLFMQLFAIYTILLSKLCGSDDIVVGTAASGRSHADLSRIIGLFFNTLAIRSNPQPELPFNRYLENIKHLTLSAFENQDYPFDRLVETLEEQGIIRREMNRNPLFDSMFALHNHDPFADTADENQTIESLPDEFTVMNPTAKFDLLFNAVEHNGALKMVLDYSTALFKPETIQKISGYFLEILRQVLEEPTIRIKDIDIVDSERDVTFDVQRSDFQDFNF